MKFVSVMIALPVTLLCTLTARAHDSWMSVAPHPARGWTVSMGTGEHFPAQEWPVTLARLERADLIGDRIAVPMLPLDETATALQLRAHPRAEPVTVAVASLRAASVTLSPDEVRTYVDGELGGDATLLARHEAQGHWRERYRKHLKMIVRRASGAAAPWVTRPAGLPYELVPRRDPTTLAAGATLRVCAFADGQRVARAYIGIVEADGVASWQWSDHRGCVRLVPRSASGYLVRSIHFRAVDAPDVDWQSDFASLTVYRLDAAHTATASAPAASGATHVP